MASAHVRAELICRRLVGGIRVAVHVSDRGRPWLPKSCVCVLLSCGCVSPTSSSESYRRLVARCVALAPVSLARVQKCLAGAEHAKDESAIGLRLVHIRGVGFFQAPSFDTHPGFLNEPASRSTTSSPLARPRGRFDSAPSGAIGHCARLPPSDHYIDCLSACCLGHHSHPSSWMALGHWPLRLGV